MRATAVDIQKALEDEIASGRYAPGARLEEIALADRFGVSRTPIREALRLLSSSGLVEIRPRRGAVVAEMSLDRLIEMFETMAEMEAVCGRLAARRMTKSERAELVGHHNQCQVAFETGDPDVYYEANARYHATIYNGTHNTFLAEEVRRLRNRLQAHRRLQLRAPDRVRDSLDEHAGITEAIVGGDGEDAARRLYAHVSIQGNRFGDWLTSLNAARLIREPAE